MLLDQGLLGNTALAATVEAEEVGRVAVPSRRGRSELALGNIAGTIIHFVALNAGVIALVKPLKLDHATTRFFLPAGALSSVVFAMLLVARNRLGRREGAALDTPELYCTRSIAGSGCSPRYSTHAFFTHG
jgi:cation:H+ antiporter